MQPKPDQPQIAQVHQQYIVRDLAVQQPQSARPQPVQTQTQTAHSHAHQQFQLQIHQVMVVQQPQGISTTTKTF